MTTTVARAFILLALLYVFLLSIQLLSSCFKLFGKDFAEALLAATSNPILGLVVGILSTSLMQSSSTTTSIVVGMVAAGAIDVRGAVPIIMGANIGTTVTNTLVSLTQVTRKVEFRRAVAGATVHDFFNVILVVVFLPLEVTTHFLSGLAIWLGGLFEGMGGLTVASPLAVITKPVAGAVLHGILNDSALLGLIVALAAMYVALKYLVDLSRLLVVPRAESVLHRYVLSAGPMGILVGMLITVLVQSSSITTSMVVPLVAAGIVSVEQVLPYTMGANIGTTITAVLASLATGSIVATEVAFTHVLYNTMGVLLVYPVPAIRRIPCRMARRLAAVSVRWRPLVFIYVAVVFYLVPLGLFLLWR